MRVSWSWKNWSPTFHAARGTFISEVWQLSAEVWRLSSRGRRPRLDIQTKAGSQTKEMKVPHKAWKVGLKVFNSWKHSNDALGILFSGGEASTSDSTSTSASGQNYSIVKVASKFLGVPLKIAGRRPAIFQNQRPEVKIDLWGCPPIQPQ